MTKHILTKFYRYFFMVLCLIVVTIGDLSAQTKSVTGKVVDEGEPLVGATVVVTGTTIGTSTDVNGNYSLEVPLDAKTLTISFIGFATETITIGNRSIVDVSMFPDMEQLSEVVIIGYGEVRKRDLTGAVESVSGDELKNTLNTSFEQALQGKIAGVQVSNNSGQPGGGVSIRIRGASGINTSSEPLYVIDGVPVDGSGQDVAGSGQGIATGFGWAGGGSGQTAISPLATLNPDEIASVEILKDASATAIYGSRASNGVVLITTKRGAEGEAEINYSTYFGIQKVNKTLDVLSLPEFASYNNEYLEKNGEPLQPSFADPSLLGSGTDWQNEIFRDATMQNHQLSISGGTAKTKYAISAGYFDQEGIVIESGFRRGSLRINVDSELKPWLKIGNSLSVSATDEQIVLNDDIQGVVTTAIRQSPANAVRNFDGTFAGSGDAPATSSFVQNPVAVAVDRDLTVKRKRALGNVYAEASFLKDFSYRTEIGGDFQINNNRGFLPSYQYDPVVNLNDISRLREDRTQIDFWIVKNYLTYDKTILDNHNINVVAGHEAQRVRWENISALISNLTTNDTRVINAGDAKTALNSGDFNVSTLESYFGRLNYSFSDKYYLTATYRADGSSKFGVENKWGYFPSFGAKWRISSESFLSGATFIDDLSLRAGYGETGNQNIPNFQFTSLIVQDVNGLGSVVKNDKFANRDVKWETTKQLNIGLDLALLQGSLNFNANYYVKRTEDALVQLSLPGQFGTNGNGSTGSPFINLGEIENKGLELALSFNKKIGQFDISSSVNYTRNRNRVIDLGPNTKPIFRGARDGALFEITRTATGDPIGSFYGYVVEGVFEDAEDLMTSAVPSVPGVDGDRDPDRGVWIGDLKFKDIDGDGVITGNDRQVIGNPQPDFIYGWSNSVKYKNFELNFLLQGVYGGEIFNFVNARATHMKGGFSNQLTDINNRANVQMIDPDGDRSDPNNWEVVNKGTDIPRLTPTDPNDNSRISDRYIEDGSYLRLRNVKLGYNIPTKAFSKYVKGASVYASVQNLLTITGYSGLDPEIGSFNQDPLQSNVDAGRYPLPLILTLGANIKL